MARLCALCFGCQGEVHAGNLVLRVEADGTVTALDREGKELTRPRTAAEVLAEAGEATPLETVVRSGSRKPVDEPPLEHSAHVGGELPREITAAEWRVREGIELPEETSKDAGASTPPGSRAPASFDEFVGQRRVVENLRLAVRAAKGRGEPLDHTLLSGPASEECLYTALEEGVVNVVVEENGGTHSVRVRLEPFTLVGATTRLGALSRPFRSRFGIEEDLEPYGDEELAHVVIAAAKCRGISANPDAAMEVGRRARGTPREALRILDRARDVAQVSGAPGIEPDHVVAAAGRLGIDEHGLDRLDRTALRLLCERGRPMGIEALAARIGVDLETYKDVHEPWLERSGFTERTKRGRIATEKARRLYGRKLLEECRSPR